MKTRKDSAPAADQLIEPADAAEIDACFAAFSKEVGERNTVHAQLGGGSALDQAGMNRTRQFVSHFFQALNNAIARGVFAREDRAYYGLGLDQESLPDLASAVEVIRWGQAIVEGDARRLADKPGAREMAMPSAEEVRAELDGWLPAHESRSASSMPGTPSSIASAACNSKPPPAAAAPANGASSTSPAPAKPPSPKSPPPQLAKPHQRHRRLPNTDTDETFAFIQQAHSHRLV